MLPRTPRRIERSSSSQVSSIGQPSLTAPPVHVHGWTSRRHRRPPVGPVVDLDLVRSLADCGQAPPCSDAEREAISRARPWGADNPRWQLFAYGPLNLMLPPGAAPSPCYVVVLVADDRASAMATRHATGATPSQAAVSCARAEAFGLAGAHRAVELTAARPPSPGRLYGHGDGGKSNEQRASAPFRASRPRKAFTPWTARSDTGSTLCLA